MSDLNILVFHRIVDEQIGEWADVRLSLFMELLKAIHNSNQDIVGIDQWRQNQSNAVVLSFDDGHLSDYETVLPLLQQYQVKGVFFITPDFVGKAGYMSWNQIRQMSDAGMEIGSHSVSHSYLSTITNRQLYTELTQSKIQIEQEIDKSVSSFAYPYGDCSGRTHRAAKVAGYQHICTSKPGLNRDKSEILSRNSVHSNITPDNIDRLLNPGAVDMLKQQLNYGIRYGLKRTLGVNNYIKLRESLYS